MRRSRDAAEPPAVSGPPEGRRSRARRPLGQVLALTALSALLPGTAHAVAGRRRTALVIGTVAAAVAVTAAVVAVRTSDIGLVRLAVQTDWLTAIVVGAAVLALAWMAVVVSSYRVLRPASLGAGRRIVAGVVVTALCAVVAAPLALAARYAYLQHDLITSVFSDQPADLPFVPQAAAPSLAPAVPPAAPEDPWAGRTRLNVLLLGGDGAATREGVRTDSMTLASVDVHTGDTVLLSLPRNLQRAPLPAGPLRDTWGSRFPDLLNAVYELVTERPALYAGAPDRGAQALKAVIGNILGVRVDYYVLVNLQGFQAMVDALGGVTLTVKERVPIAGIAPNGQFVRPRGYIEPGRQKLDGYEALWYARSRSATTDYDRMARQRCIIGALARQADPLNVLARYQKLASTTKKILSTDLPRDLLPDLVELGGKVRTEGEITSLQFVPPLIDTAAPDYRLIRSRTRAAIAASGREDAAATAAPGPSPSATAGAPAKPRPSRTPPPAQKVDEVCSLD